MLAFFGNLAPTEVLVLAVVAVLVFGKRLPEVAGRGYTQLRRWRQSLDHLRRETGIDKELRNIEHGVRDVQRKANLDEALAHEEPAEPRPVSRSEPVLEPEEAVESPLAAQADQGGLEEEESEPQR